MQRIGDAAAALKLPCLALWLSALCACAAPRLDMIQAGPWFAAKSWREVEVFSSKNEIRLPWGGIAVIHSKTIPADAPEQLQALKRAARKMAAKAGADGIVIGVEQLDGGVSGQGELYISALAIKYVIDTSTSQRP